MGSIKKKDSKIKILILMEPIQVRDVILFNVESKFGFELIDPHSEAEAIGFLAQKMNIDLIIIDTSSTWSNLIQYIVESKASFKVLEIQSKTSLPLPSTVNIIKKMNKDKVMAELPAFLTDFLKTIPSETKANTDSESEIQTEEIISRNDSLDANYCRVKTHLLLEVSPLKSDIYIRLSATKYLKLFMKGASFEKQDLERYLEKKKIEELYLKNDETKEFLSKIDSKIDSLLKKENLTVEEATNAASSTLDMIQNLSKNIGFSPEVQKIFQSNVSLVMKSTARSSKLSALLKGLMNEKDKYIAAHSIVTGQVACAIAQELDWRSDMTFQKLVTAAMMHDIALTNHKLAQVKNLEELKTRENEFSKEDVKAFQMHPIAASDIAKGFSDMPADVDIIILQHHEKPDGNGFPKHLSATRISPLASLFIIAHDIVHEYLDKGDAFDIQGFIDERKEFYSAGNFKKAIAGLEKAEINIGNK